MQRRAVYDSTGAAMSDDPSLLDLETQIYTARRNTDRLRREVFGFEGPALQHLEELAAAESELSSLERQLKEKTSNNPASGRLLHLVGRPAASFGTLGRDTTAMEADVHLRMAAVTTSIYHLLDRAQSPLLTCRITNLSTQTRRLRISSNIEGYSAHAVDTIEIPAGSGPLEIHQLPTIYPQALASVNELTRASLNVLIEELLDGGTRVESQSTHPIWLLARTSAPLAVKDPATGGWIDHSRYLGAFVTPNAPELMSFLRQAVELHPQKRLAGYQGDRSQVEPQVRALYDALKSCAEIQYVNSVIAFNPDAGVSNQRVRLPRESLSARQANCIDGVVLFASLLEAVSLNPGLVIVPGHAFLAWETWNDGSDEWRYLETTLIGSGSFDEAAAGGAALAAHYRKLCEQKGDPNIFRLWPLRRLRTEFGITPVE